MKGSLPRAALRRLARSVAVVFLLALPAGLQAQAPELARQVEIRRTAYGVPHIRAENLRAAGYGLAYAQMEDYGFEVVRALLRARGALAVHYGRDSLESDFGAQRVYRQAERTYARLDGETRAVMEGFAAGVNRYVELHPGEFPAWVRPEFSALDVHAQGIDPTVPGDFRRLIARLDGAPVAAVRDDAPLRLARATDEGSNAWALAPSRTKSGRAILLRNPHLDWDAGYYEAQLTVPGKLDFYGDFRVGGPMGTIGGFNRRLGWSTTNNHTDNDEVYALRADPAQPDHYLFDGASVPLTRELVTVRYLDGDSLATETRESWISPLGPVFHRSNGTIYVFRTAAQDEWLASTQFLRMMEARDLAEWKDAMRLRGRAVSNFTYADADGNIFYVWNAALPVLPHPSGGDTAAVEARGAADVFQRTVAWDSLPQMLNPRSGYLYNSNDAPFYANLEQPLDTLRYPANVERPSLGLRSQLAAQLLHSRGKLSLEDVVRRKHSVRMLLADRVKPDLLAALRASRPHGDTARAVRLLARWDNTVARESRGGPLFEAWWERYLELVGSHGSPDTDPRVFRETWSPAHPASTPLGLADPAKAVEAFGWAMQQVTREAGSWSVAWGDVFRARRGSVDVPVGGCSGALGCFRVLWYQRTPDGEYLARGGDGWVLAVEFDDVPRAYSVLAYGQSDRPDSPHYSDQLALFADKRMKPVAFTEADIQRQLERPAYHPGLE